MSAVPRSRLGPGRFVLRILSPLVAATAVLAPGSAAAAAAASTSPAASAAAHRPSSHTATIVSVDGPGLLTVRDGARSLKLRLTRIDSPFAASATAPAECGADGATAALRFITAKYRRVEYEVIRARGADPAKPKAVRPVRDLDGRLLAEAAPAKRGGSLGLADRLVAGGWARWGAHTDGTSSPIRGSMDALAAITTEDEDDIDLGALASKRGVWAVCGGRFHLPGGAPVAPPAPVAWNLDADGVLKQLGSAAVPAVDALPKGAPPITLGTLLASFPDAELITEGGGSCTAWAPTSGVLLAGLSADAFGSGAKRVDCLSMVAVVAVSLLPETPILRGAIATGITGDPVGTFRPYFPRSHLDDEADPSASIGFLFGTPRRTDDDGIKYPLGIVYGSLESGKIQRLSCALIPPLG